MAKEATKTNFILSKETAKKYLDIYVTESDDWDKELQNVYNSLLKKNPNVEQAKKNLKKIIACAILLPYTDKTRLPHKKESILFHVPSYHQFKEEDWVKKLQNMIQEDYDIEKKRNKLLDMGIVYPIEYSPTSRQAVNWIYKHANEADYNIKETEEYVNKLNNIVYAYGGKVVIGVFEKTGPQKLRNRVYNWHTMYFFEKLIHHTYSFKQIQKIKQEELTGTNHQLVCKLDI